MNKAGWPDVWHMALTIVAHQPPFLQIMYWTGVVFIAVMAIDGLRTSLLAIWRAHRSPSPQAAASTELSTVAEAPTTRAFSIPSVPRAAPTLARNRKTLTVGARQFRSPRPTIRRHPMPAASSVSQSADMAADSAVPQHESV